MEDNLCKIFCVGGASIDRHFNSLQTIVSHSSNPVTSNVHLGGVARNVASNLAQITNDIYLQTIIGNDQPGLDIIANAKQLSIDIADILILKHKQTAQYFSILDKQGELHLALADMQIYESVNWLQFANITRRWQENSLIFLDMNLHQSIIDAVILYCQQQKIRLCVDPVSVTKSEKLRNRLMNIYLLKANKLEASTLANVPINNIEDGLFAAKTLITVGVEQVVISLGSSGYIIANKQGETHYPVKTIDNIKNVVGCGDAFMAGILYGLKVGASIEKACAIGANLASITVQAPTSVAIHSRYKQVK